MADLIKKLSKPLCLLCLVGLISCSTPSKQFNHVAINSGFVGSLINSGQFRHQLFFKAAAEPRKSTGTLHVYLDGDGSPWDHQRWIADDPTPRNPMILELMRQDNNPALFLGRPCYHGFSKVAPCQPKHWTSHRYSEDIIKAMTLALNQWLQQNPHHKIVLIGFSGGGTLAVLMAPNIPHLETVVTLAANLDVAAWSAYHHYQPLSDSLNPAAISIKSRYQQIHLAGLKDQVVPAFLIKTYAEKQMNAIYKAYPNFDHHCCWLDAWPAILDLF